jgi:hypothetical protein
MWSPATVRLLVFIGFYVLFLAVGAFVFSAIEAPEEAARVRELKELRQDFLDGHTCVQGTFYTHILLHYHITAYPSVSRGPSIDSFGVRIA